MRIMITGGTSGIGAAIAMESLRAGHQVFVTGRNVERLQHFLSEADTSVAFLPAGIVADAGDWEETQQAVDAARTAMGGIDVAVANAGFSGAGNFSNGDPDLWKSMVLTNVYGPAILARATLKDLTTNRGHFTLIGSTAGKKVYPGNLYTATKWAVTGLAESLRQQLVGTGIRVSLISPGHVDTPLWQEKPDAAVSAADIGKAVLWALEQPSSVDISEMVVRATGQHF
jgi:NADP-dependent 3-hydroxy acid dehydrogenase YdfG